MEQTHLGRVLLSELADNLGVVGRELDGLLLRVAEDNRSEERGSGVVEVDDYVLGSRNGSERPVDEVGTGRGQDLSKRVTVSRGACKRDDRTDRSARRRT